MAKIAIFDSGLGSLSVIQPLQKTTKSEIIYFADQINFPYGKKTKSQLFSIITKTIDLLKNKFSPDLIVIGSNTPTLLLDEIFTSKIIGVLPPLQEAAKKSKTNHIAILATQSVTKSNELHRYIIKNLQSKKTKVKKINASSLIDLVESGKFITNKKLCKKIIKNTLSDVILLNDVDVATLSSTHLPFLSSLLHEEFPFVDFLDPAQDIMSQVVKLTKNKSSNKNSLKIFSSGNINHFQKQLQEIGIKNKVNFLSL